MRLEAVRIRNFRRFSDLTVKGIPASVRLLILVGPNGCGKSSFFDALHTWRGWKADISRAWDSEYHAKAGSPPRSHFQDDVTPTFHNQPIPDVKKSFYVRSAYRNSPDLQLNHLSRSESRLTQTRLQRVIDNDAAVQQNYHDLVSKGMQDLYESGDDSMTFAQYRKTSIGTIKDSLLELFPNLELNSLGDPLKDGTFRFTKGTSSGFHFKNLSGGEKAAFDLILDLVVASRDYDDTVFCIDEPESHLHARLQAKLLTVLYDIIPDTCQLMLATHSVGMIRQARAHEDQNPGSVAFLDFDQDFDGPIVIEPVCPDRSFWKRVYSVALDDLSDLLAPGVVVICEGEPRNRNAGANYGHDARCYATIFAGEFPETEFVPGGSALDVSNDKRGIAYALQQLTRGVTVIRLVDRDDRSDREVEDLSKSGHVRVLGRRNLETFLFDDEILRALGANAGAESDIVEELIKRKKTIIAGSEGGAIDDLKPVSGAIYIACKDILGLTQCGNDARAFMRDTLAPLVTKETKVYRELKDNILGGLE